MAGALHVYDPSEFSAEVPHPDGIFSYRTESDGGRGAAHMWAVANMLRLNGITSYCGLMVREANWQQKWFGKMYKAKFAIIMTSDKYWDPNSPCREEVEAILQRGLKVFILRVDATCSTCMRGDFLGTSEDEIDSAGFLKSRLGALNCFPPPHKPLFQVRASCLYLG
jgi:hypothetical protein